MSRRFFQRAAFSLVEVSAALALVAFSLLAILGLIPVALKASREAVDDTRASLIAQDAATHLRAMPATSATTKTEMILWYDRDGRYVEVDASKSDYSNAMYRADVARGRLNSYPAHTAIADQDPANGDSTQLMGAIIVIRWPVNTTTGEPPANGTNRLSYSFLVRTTP